jgi:hypothetical protein
MKNTKNTENTFGLGLKERRIYYNLTGIPVEGDEQGAYCAG